MTETLLPCPFCGKRPEVRNFNGQPHYVFCKNDVRMLLEDWNTRAQPSPSAGVADVEALKRDVDGTGSSHYNIGWNACIDHLVSTGRLAQPNVSPFSKDFPNGFPDSLYRAALFNLKNYKAEISELLTDEQHDLIQSLLQNPR